MINDNIKKNATTYKGYEYQTLFGISILADWLSFPNKYQKVLFEATDDTDQTPQSLDDVICIRNDNTYDYYQVKYSPSPEKSDNEFSWNWLLKKSGKTDGARSILKKIYDAYKRIPSEHINSINLVTNKRLARNVEPCFQGTSYLKFNLIPQDIQNEIVTQLGDATEARIFVERLKIAYEDPIYSVLENRVRETLLKVSDEIGYFRLLAEAKKWATIRNYPAPEGWITLDILRSVISTRRPEPISQSFHISEDYILPNEDFHKNFTNKVISENEQKILVLTGSPGLGKSTYLSYLCNELEKEKIPYIRHHYFISTSDRTQDRLSLRVIAESLFSQIRKFHNKAIISSIEQPENISKILKECGEYYQNRNKPFILLIDGLDHVWRDNNKDIKPLDEVFKTLLPLPDNVKMVVGTQPVDDIYLPERLLTFCPKKNWIYLPSMSGDAISAYITKRIEEHSLIMNDPDNRKESIANAASALLNLTHGYPLQLIYTCEYLKTHQLPINEWQINRLPMQSDGDIQEYYLSIWHRLSYKQRNTLHLIVNFNFFWPRDSFDKVLSDSTLDINSIIFLLHESLSGLRPFHESLSVFVKNRENHKQIIESLLPSVCAWLENYAPDSLRQRWLWYCQALLGNTEPLRKGLSRDWVIDRLIEGYEPNFFIDLLTQAETIAFTDSQYAEAYKHRSLKTRLLNGPEYQLTDFNQLKIIFLTTASQSAINELISLNHQLSVTELGILSIALWYRGEKQQALSMANWCYTKFLNEQRLYTYNRHNELYEKNIELMITAKVLNDDGYIPALIAKNAIKTWDQKTISLLCQINFLNNNLQQLLDVFNTIEDKNFKKLIAEKVIILGAFEQIEFDSLENDELFEVSSIAKIAQILEKELFKQSHIIYDSNRQYHDYTTDKLVFDYKDYFFDNLLQHLSAQGEFSRIYLRSCSNSIKVPLYNLLVDFGDHIAKLIEYKEEINFIDIYSLLNSTDIPIHYHYKDSEEANKFKYAWFEISLIINLIINQKSVSLIDFKGAEEKEYFNIYWFIEWYAEQNIKYFENDVIEYLFEIIDKRFQQEVQETNERGDYFSNLAKIALLHQNLVRIKQYCYQCWDLILGYGWRKDGGILELLDSIEYLSHKDQEDALLYLKEVAAEVVHILEYTDGKGTRHALSQYTKQLSNINLSCLVSKFECEVENGEWSNAEESFHKILINLPNLSSPILESLCRTGLSQEDLYALQKNLNTNRANELIQIALSYNGLNELPEYFQKNKESFKDEVINPINYEDYPLEKFPDFLTWVKSDYKNREHLLLWMDYWKSKGQLSDFIKYVWSEIKDKELLYKDENLLLDPLYEIARRIKGKKYAFDILTKAQSNNGGWHNYWFETTERTFKRLDIVVKDYKERADEFIKKSTQNNAELNKELVIPSSKLVYFLVQLDRVEEAKVFISAMIEVLKEETRNLNLQKPDWNWTQSLNDFEIAVALLVNRLHWPFTSIKQWAANELSNLLVSNEYGNMFEAKLLANLQSKKLESEVVEILCVFWIAKQKGYQPSVNLGDYVFARSCLSDQLLESIEPQTSNYGYYQGTFDTDLDLIEKESNLRKVLGAELPMIYLDTLQKLEDKYLFPLTEDFQHEWNKTFKNESRLNDTYQYFLETDETSQFYTLNSHRGRSAYLRVLEVAKRHYGMPNDYTNYYSIKALPLETSYLDFTSSKVSWFKNWDKRNEYNVVNLKDYLQELIQACNTSNNSQLLGSLSFPLEISSNLQLDITCTLLNDRNQATERINIISNGVGLEKKLAFHFVKPGKTSVDELPFIGTAYPHHRYGHWFVEQESRGIFIPIISNESQTIIGKSDDKVIKYYLEGMQIGMSGYWNEGWKRTYPPKMNPKCATYTLLSPEYFHRLEVPITYYRYTCHVQVASKERDYGDFEIKELNFEIEF